MPNELLKTAIVFLDYNRLYFYGSNIVDRVIPLNIPPTAYRDLEIISEDELANLIKSYTQYHKILPSDISLIISDSVCFASRVPVVQGKTLNINDATNYFLDMVPFENITSRTFIWEKETMIVAMNQKLYSVLLKSFQLCNFHIDIIIPSFVLGNDINFKNGLDLVTAQNIMTRIDQAKQYNILKDQNIPHPTSGNINKNPTQSEDNKTLIYLLPVLVFLIVILVILLNKAQSMPTPKKTSMLLYSEYKK
jgi:hypothetical protein